MNLAVQNERPRRQQQSEQTTITSVLKHNRLDDTIASEILLIIIKWIHHLPTFQNLPIDDQVFVYFYMTSSKKKMFRV